MAGITMYGVWDQGLVDLITKFRAFSPMMNMQMTLAMNKIGTRIVNQARSNMHWKSPTGALSASIRQIDSPTQVLVGSDLPYAWRREKGFSGMTDALGRYYRFDPGQYYLTRALFSTVPFGEKTLMQAVMTSLGTIGPVGP